MTKEEYVVTQAVMERLDKFESELEAILLDLEPLDVSRLDTVVRDETIRMFNCRSRSYILLLETVVYKDTLKNNMSCGSVKIDGESLDEEK